MFKYKVNDMVRVRLDINVDEPFSEEFPLGPTEKAKAKGNIYKIAGTYKKYYLLEGLVGLLPEEVLVPVEGEVKCLNIK